MSRGYWCIILASFGWLIAAAAEPPAIDVQQSIAPVEESEAEKARQPFAPYPDLHQDACYRAEDHNQSDLCAQWRAALAAERAASAGERANTWMVISTILSGIGLGALLVTLLQSQRNLLLAQSANKLNQDAHSSAERRAGEATGDTQRALAIARDNADAAISLAESTRRSIVKERAWLCPVGVDSRPYESGFWNGEPRAKALGFIVNWINFGSVPAVNFGVNMWLETSDGEPLQYFEVADADIPGNGICGPGQAIASSMAVMTDEQTRRFREKQIDVIIKSKIIYASVLSVDSHRSFVEFRATHGGGTMFVNGKPQEPIVYTVERANVY